MKEYIFTEEKDITIGNKIVKSVGMVTIFKYKNYYKIGIAGIDEVFYFRLRTAEEVAILLESDIQSKIEDISKKIQKISEENIDIAVDLYNDIKNMSEEDHPEKDFILEETEEENELESRDITMRKVSGKKFQAVKFKLNDNNQIELEHLSIPSELCYEIYEYVKNIENLKK